MRGIGKKKLIKDGLIGYIQRIIITTLIIMFVAFLLNVFIKIEYGKLLKYTSFIVIVIGALSVVGSTNITYDASYAYHKAQTGLTGTTKNDIKLLQGSYGFCIFMGITAVILYIISLLL